MFVNKEKKLYIRNMENKYFVVHRADTNALIAFSPNQIAVVTPSKQTKGSTIHLVSVKSIPINVNETPTKVKELMEKSCKCLDVHGCSTNNLMIIPHTQVELIYESVKSKSTIIKMKCEKYNTIEVNESVTKIVATLNE